ncbi:IclR family transcriptional regulator [Novosphingobium sp. SG720]|uniref:IclR family transcriptional regulator n=1 Tax=Novosphingobium sp. SG720 TaxID=2586998 RepID=UPI001447BA73|nr:IclR family transcriptional regulator [Novosphingobium sp. SG720]NKJ44121.1 DNA-binding IclR family transcriptional regulator [Novosphingobium sp. SG720]
MGYGTIEIAGPAAEGEMMVANPESESLSDSTLSTDERRRKYAVPALEKGLDIVEYLADQAVPMTQSQLARALNRQPGELFRMLACLEGRGYVRRDPTNGGYALTLKLFQLARIHSPYETLIAAARPLMRALSDEVRESCHLTVLQGSQVLVLTQEESPNPFRLSVEVGSTHSPLRTNSGRLLLAGLAPSALDAWLAHSREWQATAPAARQELLARIEDVRQRGHARSLGERFLGGADIGVLVGTPGAPLNAALTIATLIDANGDARLDPLLEPLERTATAIGMAAGLTLDGLPRAGSAEPPPPATKPSKTRKTSK